MYIIILQKLRDSNEEVKDCLLLKYHIMQSTENETEPRLKFSTDFYDIFTLKMVKKTLGSYSYIVSAFILFFFFK